PTHAHGKVLTVQPYVKFTVLLRPIRLTTLAFGVVTHRWLNSRHQRDRSSNSTPIRMHKCVVIRSNSSSFGVAPHASLRKYRTSCRSSLPCWTEQPVVSQRTSWIHQGLI